MRIIRALPAASSGPHSALSAFACCRRSRPPCRANLLDGSCGLRRRRQNGEIADERRVRTRLVRAFCGTGSHEFISEMCDWRPAPRSELVGSPSVAASHAEKQLVIRSTII